MVFRFFFQLAAARPAGKAKQGFQLWDLGMEIVRVSQHRQAADAVRSVDEVSGRELAGYSVTRASWGE